MKIDRIWEWREKNVYKLRDGVKVWPLTADEFDDYLAAFAQTVEAQTREECAKVAEEEVFRTWKPVYEVRAQIATAIRSLPQASAQKKEPLSLNSNEQQ